MKLDDIGLKYDTDKSSRSHGYLDFYEKHFPNRDFSGRILEIGVMDGYSLKTWGEYYPKAEIIGIDIKEPSPLFLPNVVWAKADGTNPEQVARLGVFDIIIDDGSHKTSEQIKSFEHLFPNQLREGGIYVVEDLHTSFFNGRDYNYIDTEETAYDYFKRLYPKAKWYEKRRGDNPENWSISVVIHKK